MTYYVSSGTLNPTHSLTHFTSLPRNGCQVQLRGLGSAVTLSSGVQGGAPATKAFCVFWDKEMRLVATSLVLFVRTEMSTWSSWTKWDLLMHWGSHLHIAHIWGQDVSLEAAAPFTPVATCLLRTNSKVCVTGLVIMTGILLSYCGLVCFFCTTSHLSRPSGQCRWCAS